MQHIFVYLLFDGACADAMHFYERVLGGQIEMTTVAESPMAGQFPTSSGHRVIHSRLRFDGNTLMASDWMASQPYPGIHGVRIMLTLEDGKRAAAVFDRLSEEGSVGEPLRKTAFARLYGTLVDRFGVPWQVMVEQ